MLRLIIPFIFTTFHLFAQEDLKNSAYLEFGGNAYYYSLNFERTFSNSISARLGIGGAPRLIVLPISVGKYFGSGSHHPEIMGGLTYIFSKENDFEIIERRNQLFITAFVGYRFQNPEKKFIFKIGYTPLFKIADSDEERNSRFLFHWGGLAFGFRF